MSIQERQIWWLEQNLADVRSDDDWMTSSERLRLETFSIPKRRSDWRLGRWTAKCAASAYLGWPAERMRDIDVSSESSGAPLLIFADRVVPPTISISHSRGVCLCAIGPTGVSIGCDIEKVEPRSESFVETFFSDREIAALRELTEDQRVVLSTVIWSVKESYLKATREGLRRDTRDVPLTWPQDIPIMRSVESQHGWLPVAVCDGANRCVAFYRFADGFVEALSSFGQQLWKPTQLLIRTTNSSSFASSANTSDMGLLGETHGGN